ncbi:MAG TPA: hypothetical protein VK102_09575 [Sphingobacterium sp.]|nr:hypothetical protein [Sphingobacterium sp.]
MKKLAMLVMPLLFFMACSEDEVPDGQEADRKHLENLKTKIENKVQDVECEDAEGWDYTALGSKACGGPQEYIAYPLSIDTEEFLSLVEEYTNAEAEYNSKYGITSDCSETPVPTGVQCENGEPVLVYDGVSEGVPATENN